MRGSHQEGLELRSDKICLLISKDHCGYSVESGLLAENSWQQENSWTSSLRKDETRTSMLAVEVMRRGQPYDMIPKKI